MPKKKSTPPQPEPQKPQVLALKKKSATPEIDAQVRLEAPITPLVEAEPPVVLEPEPTPEVLPEPADAQPESIAPTLGAEVKTDAPSPTPELKPNRPVLKKKSDAVRAASRREGGSLRDHRDAIASSETPSTPELLEAPPDGALFQAVGIIVGDVNFNEEGKAKLAFGGKEYPLFYAPPHKRAYEALKIEIKKTGVLRQRLLVYPRITHFPKREEPHQVSFQLVGFRRQGTEPDPNDAISSLNNLEFKLAGLWQFIPVCATPCVSIFKNYTTERKDFIKEADVAVKVKFMKGSHVPVMWRDAPVRPFRFNPKLDSLQQGSAAFVALKARFDPDKDVFVFQELTSTPSSQPPRFLKAGKKDRLQVASEKLKAARGVKGNKEKPQIAKKP